MNKRNFIISVGAALALVMLATCYAAVTALLNERVPQIAEDYRQTVQTAGGNPLRQLGDDFAEIFLIIGDRLTG